MRSQIAISAIEADDRAVRSLMQAVSRNGNATWHKRHYAPYSSINYGGILSLEPLALSHAVISKGSDI